MDNEAKALEKNKKGLTAGYYFLKLLPPGLLFILTAAVYLCCAYFFLRIFFSINGDSLDAFIMRGEYMEPLNALIMILLGLMGGLLLFFMVAVIVVLLSSLLFPMKIVREAFIENANIAYARIIKLWDEDLKKSDDRCDADVVVAPRGEPNFRARVKVPLGGKSTLAEGSKILVAYTFANNYNKRTLEKIISVKISEIPRERFEAIIRPAEKPENDKAEHDPDSFDMPPDEGQDMDGFEPADFTMMEVTDGEDAEYADENIDFL